MATRAPHASPSPRRSVFAPGDQVLVAKAGVKGTGDLATVLEAKGNDRGGIPMYRVHYLGWGVRYDEWLPTSVLSKLEKRARSTRKSPPDESAPEDLPPLEPGTPRKRRQGRARVSSRVKTERTDGGGKVSATPVLTSVRGSRAAGSRKRKILQNGEAAANKSVSTKPKRSRAKKSKYFGGQPFPKFAMPSEELCYLAHHVLCGLYGEPDRRDCSHNEFSLLDSLCRTILSQNTTDNTSARAFASLKRVLPTWKEVLHAKPGVAEDAIRCGGLADVKMERIRQILKAILEEFPSYCRDGEPSLNYLEDWPTERVKQYLSGFKGVGPKTISCLLMFAMGRAEFPVDTHVWKIALKLGWIPKNANREAAYQHLNLRIPELIKYDLHVLLVKHGKVLKNELGGLSIAKAGKLVGKELKVAELAKAHVHAKAIKLEKKHGKKFESRPKKELTLSELQMTGATSPVPKVKRERKSFVSANCVNSPLRFASGE